MIRVAYQLLKDLHIYPHPSPWRQASEQNPIITTAFQVRFCKVMFIFPLVLQHSLHAFCLRRPRILSWPTSSYQFLWPYSHQERIQRPPQTLKVGTPKPYMWWMCLTFIWEQFDITYIIDINWSRISTFLWQSWMTGMELAFFSVYKLSLLIFTHSSLVLISTIQLMVEIKSTIANERCYLFGNDNNNFTS